MNPEPRRYQARITGYEYGITTDGKGRETRDGWNMEWAWHPANEPEEIDFDGFVVAQCLLQEAKGNYDQFLDDNDQPVFYFRGFDAMAKTIRKHGRVVRNNPPSRVMWYFETERTRHHMFDVLSISGVPSVFLP
ncbi:restriction endonuclease fold toxin 5 domain-containing protein [Paraburkholderia sp. MMS20-SJTN17]|uniref:Restriction endonuclease fold toxin 5 domain-containing protein n=1 Tax=Paraburkholderia translucens TaxID=2886945 RepID=A0ABS8KLD1_9BURK|nr:restriction endonuclease fold toxin 5 domain-containing protein [Paraburkholderia sp. MMS20-SJTN17]MCC8405577.1 restriction endonuclease fold toxin 5 domain-containing protein [Paraburkholderia sp. MMS20-SJTN17]